jgi:uncharacterized protein
MYEERELTLRVLESLSSVEAAAWNAMVRPQDTPFLRYEWLFGLEQCECVGAERGWLPQHITLWDEDKLVAACPCYLKGNWQGEFVFDQAWERLSERLGEDYYPKLVVAVPFTPATGTRLLVAPDQPRPALERLLARGLRMVVERLELSGVHILFPQQEQLASLEAEGFLIRYGVQNHWKNQEFKTYPDFLASFNAKRRHQLKRERRMVVEQGIQIKTHRGQEITKQALESMIGFYHASVDRFFPYTQRYLTPKFFQWVVDKMPEHIEIVLAYQEEKAIAGAFNVSGDGVLYGRYWGSDAEIPFLHFEVCYYHSIEQCIDRGFRLFEPGAGGQHKLPRGFEPTITYSAHWLRNPRMRSIIGEYLGRERQAIEEHVSGSPEEQK